MAIEGISVGNEVAEQRSAFFPLLRSRFATARHASQCFIPFIDNRYVWFLPSHRRPLNGALPLAGSVGGRVHLGVPTTRRGTPSSEELEGREPGGRLGNFASAVRKQLK
jgi:hypothetical protein